MAPPRNINSDMSEPRLFVDEGSTRSTPRYMGPSYTSPMIGMLAPGRPTVQPVRASSPYAAAAQAAATRPSPSPITWTSPMVTPGASAYYQASEAAKSLFPEGGDTGPTMAETIADILAGYDRGGGSSARILYDPDPESTRSQALIDAISSGYGGMRQAEQDYLDALISQVGAQRTGAQQRAADAAAAADRTIAGLVEAAAMSGQNVGQAYSQAQQQVADLIGQYAAEQAARQQGAQQTLGMFGAPTEMAVPGGITPMDYLAAQQAAMGRFGAAEQAYFGGAPTRYEALGSDYARQRQTALEQALAELDAQQAQREAEVARSLSQLNIQEQQAILNQQQAEWERQARYPREV